MSISTLHVGLMCFSWTPQAKQLRVKQLFLVVWVRVGGCLVPFAAWSRKKTYSSSKPCSVSIRKVLLLQESGGTLHQQEAFCSYFQYKRTAVSWKEPPDPYIFHFDQIFQFFLFFFFFLLEEPLIQERHSKIHSSNPLSSSELAQRDRLEKALPGRTEECSRRVEKCPLKVIVAEMPKNLK